MKKFNLCARARRAIWLSVSLISFGVCSDGLDKRDQSAIGSKTSATVQVSYRQKPKLPLLHEKESGYRFRQT